MGMTTSKFDTVCFTGHRPEKLTQSEETVREALRKGIDQALAWRCTTFISGMAPGVDIWAAEEILALKRKNPEVKLVCAVPFDGFARNWDDDWKNRYTAILAKADEVFFVSPGNMRAVAIIRDKWMVDHSSLVIAFYNGEKGGTRTTIDYAEKKKVRVLNVFKEE